VYEIYGSHLIHNGAQQCWTCSRTIENGLAAKNKLFRMYKCNAQRRGHVFEIDFDYMINLCSLPCNYCGAAPSSSAKKLLGQRCNGDFIYNGIDRVDNSIGYTNDNCVPCCTPCNMMKKKMGREQFLAHVHKIAIHQGMLSHV
jgi:hypothetical protein